MPTVQVVKPDELIEVHGVLVNYDQLPQEAAKSLPHSLPLISSSFDPAKWNGGKSGQKETTLRLRRSDRSVSTEVARQFVRSGGDIPCLPAEVAPLAEVWQELWEIGLWYVAALGEDDSQLWRDANGQPRVVFLDCNPKYVGINLHCNVGWYHLAWFAGIPG